MITMKGKPVSFTKEVITMLKDKPLSVNEIASHTALSMNYVRTQLRLMETGGIIERVDMRTPIIYRASANHPEVKDRENIDKAKASLLKPAKEDEAPISALLKQYPKNLWGQIGEALGVYAMAVKELEEEGKLINTL